LLGIEKKKIRQKYEEKLKKAEAEFQAQLDAELPSKIEKAIAQKEKDLKLKYKRQLELDKRSYETKAKANYEANITNELKKFEAEQTEFARKKSAYNNMVNHFERQRKEMSAKLRESELILMRKQGNVGSGETPIKAKIAP